MESIFQVYKDAEVPQKWTETLANHCKKIDITFMSTPYDLDTVDHLNKFIPAFKIGSGDLAWDDMINKILSTKTFFIATGASTMKEVEHAVKLLKEKNKFCLMQCNTNYTGSSKLLIY